MRQEIPIHSVVDFHGCVRVSSRKVKKIVKKIDQMMKNFEAGRVCVVTVSVLTLIFAAKWVL